MRQNVRSGRVRQGRTRSHTAYQQHSATVHQRFKATSMKTVPRRRAKRNEIWDVHVSVAVGRQVALTDGRQVALTDGRQVALTDAKVIFLPRVVLATKLLSELPRHFG